MKEEERKALKERRDKEVAELKGAINRVLETADGKRLFKYLCYICGFDKPGLYINPRTGELHSQGIVYNEARRSVYLQVRALADKALLPAVEYSANEMSLEGQATTQEETPNA